MQSEERSNKCLELAVRFGIILDREAGAVCAWNFMVNNGVSNAVIMRVLLDEKSRRESDRLVLGIAEKVSDRIRRETVQTAFGVRR